MFMRVPLLLAGLLASSSLVACVGAAPEPTADPTSSTATAIVVVERTAGPGESVRGDTVTARFLRVRQGAVDDPALRMAGVAEEIPAPGGCLTPSDAPSTMQGRSVELLDVGQVVLTGEGAKSTVLLPRSMPDPAGVVSGVLYSSTSRAADLFSPGSRVSLRSSGGTDLAEGFSVSVGAPREIGDVRVAPSAAGLDVTWDSGDADPKDVVYVEVTGPGQRGALRCTATETGHLVLPAALEDGQVAVHRVHKESFRAKGIEPGEVRFDVAKVVSFRR